MKAKDLMSGDWVEIVEPDDFHGYKGEARITNDITGYVTVAIPFMHTTDVLCDDLQPIPLTPEILDKNGIMPDNVFKEWRRINEKYWLIYCDDGNYTMSIQAPHPFDDGDVLHNFAFGIKYVHTLQHLIKELKIEKTIII